MLSHALEHQSINELLYRIFSGHPASPPVVDPGVSVVLYGAGQLGRLASSFCQHVGVNIQYVLDRSAVPGQMLDGVPVFMPADATVNRDHPVLITVVTSSYSSIKNDLQAAGWERVLPFYDYAQRFVALHPLNNGWFAEELSSRDRAEISTVLDRLADADSKSAYLQFLAWRILREEWILNEAPVTIENRYFIPEVTAVLTDREQIVDCGAYDGRFFFKLLEITRGNFASARLFEPDAANLILLQRALGRLPAADRSKIEASEHALSDVTGILLFSQGFDMTSRLSDEGHSMVSAVKLDDLSIDSSYLKIHVEGAELRTLAGAADTLKKHRPIIAVTVYHNRDGLWKIPSLLLKTLDGYDFLFRLHNWCGTGAVLYAIPRERLGMSA